MNFFQVSHVICAFWLAIGGSVLFWIAVYRIKKYEDEVILGGAALLLLFGLMFIVMSILYGYTIFKKWKTIDSLFIMTGYITKVLEVYSSI